MYTTCLIIVQVSYHLPMFILCAYTAWKVRKRFIGYESSVVTSCITNLTASQLGWWFAGHNLALGSEPFSYFFLAVITVLAKTDWVFKHKNQEIGSFILAAKCNRLQSLRITLVKFPKGEHRKGQPKNYSKQCLQFYISRRGCVLAEPKGRWWEREGRETPE